jgi:hypothetical protein
MCKCQKDSRLIWLENYLCKNFPNNPYIIEPYQGISNHASNILYFGEFLVEQFRVFPNQATFRLSATTQINNFLLTEFDDKGCCSGYQITFKNPVY